MSREDGYKNLVPMNQRSKDEARSLGQQGGITSGAARRRKRSMREAADYYLSLPETDRRRVNAMLRDAIDPEDIDNQMAVVMGVTERAKRGDPQAASVLLKMLGEDGLEQEVKLADKLRALDLLGKHLGMYKDTSEKDPAADALAKAKELLGGVDSAID